MAYSINTKQQSNLDLVLVIKLHLLNEQAYSPKEQILLMATIIRTHANGP
jgi:hypothetical protein